MGNSKSDLTILAEMQLLGGQELGRAGFSGESLSCKKEGTEHTHQGCAGSSLTWLLTLSLLTLASPRLSSASPMCASGFFVVVVAFLFSWGFFSSVEKYHFDDPRGWVSCAGAAVTLSPEQPLVFGLLHRLCPQLLLGVSHGTLPPPR